MIPNKRLKPKYYLSRQYVKRTHPIQLTSIAICIWVTFFWYLAGCCTIPEQDAQLSIKGSSQVDLLKPISYKINIANEKKHSIKDIKIIYTVPPVVTYISSSPQGIFKPKTQREPAEVIWHFSELAAKTTADIDLVVKGIKGGFAKNTIKLVSSTDPFSFVEASTDINVLIKPALHIDIKESSSYQKVSVFERINYTITIANEETYNVKNAKLIYTVPLIERYVSSSPSGFFKPATQRVPGEVIWHFSELPAKTTAHIQLLVRGIKGGFARNSIKLVSNTDSFSPIEASTDIEILIGPAVLYSLVDTEDPCEVGKKTTYILKIERNPYTVFPMSNLQISCKIPEQMELVEAIGGRFNNFTNGKILFAPIPILSPGESVEYRITCKALKPSSVKFIALLQWNFFNRPIILEERTTVYK